MRTKENSVFRVSRICSIKMITCLRLNFSHLNEHKFRHSFNHTINLMSNCGAATETATHYVLVADFISELFRRSATNSCFVWFRKIALNVNKEIIRLTISYLKVSERFVQTQTKVLFIYSFVIPLCLIVQG